MRPIDALHAGSAAALQKPPSAESLKAAREFESLLLRHVLKSLEKTTQVGPSAAGGSTGTYRSMIVDALSDGIAQAGGLGLAEMIARSLEGPAGRPHAGSSTPQALPEPAVHTDEAHPGLEAIPVENER